MPNLTGKMDNTHRQTSYFSPQQNYCVFNPIGSTFTFFTSFLGPGKHLLTPLWSSFFIDIEEELPGKLFST